MHSLPALAETLALERRLLTVLRLQFKLVALRYWLRKYSPGQPRVPAGNPDGGQWTSDTSLAPRLVASKRISPAKEAECEAQRLRDEFQCRMVGLRACWQQAYLRYANCLRDLPIPPLNY